MLPVVFIFCNLKTNVLWRQQRVSRLKVLRYGLPRGGFKQP